MHHQEVKNTALSIFDDERNYLGNIKNLPWNLKIWFCIPFFLFERAGAIVYVF